MKLSPSNDPVDENDQHDPHYPWFLTGVTAPLVLQSIDAGIDDSSNYSYLNSVFLCNWFFYNALNSKFDKSAN